MEVIGLKEKGQVSIKISVTGTLFIAFALVAILGLAVGSALNQILPGSGNLSIVVGAASFIILIIMAILYVLSEQ